MPDVFADPDRSHMEDDGWGVVESQKHPGLPDILGIWRVGGLLYESSRCRISLAQPADSRGNPRWDYVIKTSSDAIDPWETRRQVNQFMAASSKAGHHPNLIQTLDGSATANLPYVVMPRLEASPMENLLLGDSPTPLPVALWFVRQAAEAVSVLHRAGWVHGNMTPANLLVDARGHLTVIDLGLAQKIHTLPNIQTRKHAAYAAPESLNGELAAIAAMDVFSLGRILWQWLTKTLPVNQRLLEPIADLVESMVSNDPSDRPEIRSVVKRLLQLELQVLGRHIGPSSSLQVA